MPRPSTSRVSPSSRNSSPSPQPTSSTLAPRSTISAISTKSTRAPPGVRGMLATVRLELVRVLIASALRRKVTRQAPCLAGAVEEAAHDAEQFRLFEQEGVVALVGDDLGERDACARSIERMHDGARFRGRKQPVAGERNHAETRGRALERIRQHAVVVGGEIEIVHGARQIEIRIGVETLDERDALVAQVRFDLEIRIERKCWILAVLEFTAEFPVQRYIGQVGDMRAHARHGEATTRKSNFQIIAAAAPVLVGGEAIMADLVERDVLRRMAGGAGNRQRRENTLRIGSGPLQHLHLSLIHISEPTR